MVSGSAWIDLVSTPVSAKAIAEADTRMMPSVRSAAVSAAGLSFSGNSSVSVMAPDYWVAPDSLLSLGLLPFAETLVADDKQAGADDQRRADEHFRTRQVAPDGVA